ncbi:Putative 2-aminoethylphosphonate transport system permease protein PhnV [Oceanobacillus oncorhynchi]|uniref:Putative 2-aminoethylphosphonate transport system permease protein PhnV n=1 Tax=Oceanobacillus oncorhynchi TaxID=545501 RepID=A0A0A1MKP5_9BACI|nr:iron ABC transporter permease [Oceanobacillus oncorhynchi]CEI80409.1 Putative 2-aminoethylphosphonate transport system permease protein PhnV [Oceanobacillus oncorhynchi]
MKNNKFINLSEIKNPWMIFTLIFVAISIITIIIPQIWIFLAAFRDNSLNFTLDNFIQFFTQERYWVALFNSAKVTVISTFFATLIAVPLAFLLSRFEFKNRNMVLTLITLATASPPFLGAYAWLILFGKYGVANDIIFNLTGWKIEASLYGEIGVIWVIIWLVFPIICLLSFDSFTAQNVSHREASMNLGANKFKTFMKIEVPLAVPGIITGMFMAGMAAFSDFGTPAVIGGSFQVLPTLVYKEFVSEVGSNLSMASTAGVVMIVISTLALIGQRYIIARKTYSSVTSKKIPLSKPGKVMKLSMSLYIGAILFISFLPHLTLVVISLMEWQWGVLMYNFTFENYIKLIDSGLKPILITFFLSFTSIFLAVFFGIGIAYVIVRKQYKFFSKFLNFIIMVPYIIPGVVFAIGLVMIFNKPPVMITGTWIILVLAYFLRKLAFTVKSAESSLYNIHPALEDAALICGAKPMKAFKDVTFRLMIGGVASGATIAFLMTMAELSTTIILYRPPWVTMVIVIFQNALTSGSDFGIAAAMGVILMLCIYVPLFIITKFSRGVKPY